MGKISSFSDVVIDYTYAKTTPEGNAFFVPTDVS
jgi:hypothetical protein